MMNEPRMPQDFSEEDLEPTKKLKLDPNKSFLSKQKPVNKENFDNLAHEVQEKRRQLLSEAFELGKQFKEIMMDKTVPSQISELKRSKDAEVISKLINFAVKVNTDQYEDEGMGSITLLTLLMKIMLQQRDRFNELDYKHHQLENYASRLEAKINSLSSQEKNG